MSAGIVKRLHDYVLGLKSEVLPKSPSGAAVRYALNQWEALTRFLGDGELEIDNGATAHPYDIRLRAQIKVPA